MDPLCEHVPTKLSSVSPLMYIVCWIWGEVVDRDITFNSVLTITSCIIVEIMCQS